MIAQGDFLKLLLADTKERQAIFRELFQTGSLPDPAGKAEGGDGKAEGMPARGEN